MEIKIKASDLDLTADVQSYIEEKAGQLEKLLGNDAQLAICDVEVSRATGHQHGDVWRAEIRISGPGESHYTQATGESVNAAIDIAKDEMMSRLRKTKTKRFALLRREGLRLKNWMRFGKE